MLRLVFGLMLLAGTGFYQAQAFKLSPMKMTLSPQGRGASGVFTVSNESSETLAVDVHLLSRSVGPDGAEINQRADEQFVVFPPQFALAPKKQQVVRIRWVGQGQLSKELAFRLVAEQLPVQLSKDATGGVNLNVGIRYLASVYVQPKGAKEKVVVKAEKESEGGLDSLLVNVCNEGSRHVILKDLTVEISCQGETITLPADQIAPIEGQNLLAGATRRVRLAWPQALPPGKPAARFDLSK